MTIQCVACGFAFVPGVMMEPCPKCELRELRERIAGTDIHTRERRDLERALTNAVAEKHSETNRADAAERREAYWRSMHREHCGTAICNAGDQAREVFGVSAGLTKCVHCELIGPYSPCAECDNLDSHSSRGDCNCGVGDAVHMHDCPAADSHSKESK